jgi:hypothetical protein
MEDEEGSNYQGEHNPDDPEYAKDFGKAYAKLVEKLYLEQGNTLLISPEEVMRIQRLVSAPPNLLRWYRKL